MPGRSAHLRLPEIENLVRSQPAVSSSFDHLRPAAVLVPLFQENGRWRLLFTRRTETLNNHKGQVSFPGGAVESQDSCPEETALREANEEIGLLPGDVRILGRLAQLQTGSNYLISPVLAYIRWPYDFSPSPLEVSRVFSIPLDWLADSRNWEERPYRSPGGTSARVIFFKPYDGEVLWGVSARITVDLLKILRLI